MGNVKKTDTIEPGYKVVVYLNEMPYREFVYFQYTENLEQDLKTVLEDYLGNKKDKIEISIGNLIINSFDALFDKVISYIPGASDIIGIAENIDGVNKNNETMDTAINLSELSTLFDVFCVSGAFVGENGKLELSGATIDYKKLATKIYVYVKKHGEFSSMKEFYNQYKGDKTNLNGEAEWLYKEIYEKNKEQDHLQQQLEIEKIESWLKGE